MAGRQYYNDGRALGDIPAFVPAEFVFPIEPLRTLENDAVVRQVECNAELLEESAP